MQGQGGSNRLQLVPEIMHLLPTPGRDQQMCSIMGQIVNFLGFVGHSGMSQLFNSDVGA